MVNRFDQGHAFFCVKILCLAILGRPMIQSCPDPSSGSIQTSTKSAFVICLALLGKAIRVDGSGNAFLNRIISRTCQAPVFQRIRTRYPRLCSLD